MPLDFSEWSRGYSLDPWGLFKNQTFDRMSPRVQNWVSYACEHDVVNCKCDNLGWTQYASRCVAPSVPEFGQHSSSLARYLLSIGYSIFVLYRSTCPWLGYAELTVSSCSAFKNLGLHFLVPYSYPRTAASSPTLVHMNMSHFSNGGYYSIKDDLKLDNCANWPTLHYSIMRLSIIIFG